MLRRQYRHMDNSSGVGVLDKAALVLAALEAGPATLAGLVAGDRAGPARPRTGSPSRSSTTAWWPATCRAGSCSARGWRELSAAAGEDRLLAAAGPVLARLRDITGESAQLYRRQGDNRVCVAAAERPTGLRDTDPGRLAADHAGRLGRPDPARLGGARSGCTAACRTPRSPPPPCPASAAAAGRSPSASASRASPRCPRRSAAPAGKVIAAVSVSGPLERLSRQPGRHARPDRLRGRGQAQRGAPAPAGPAGRGPARPAGPAGRRAARAAGCPSQQAATKAARQPA